MPKAHRRGAASGAGSGFALADQLPMPRNYLALRGMRDRLTLCLNDTKVSVRLLSASVLGQRLQTQICVYAYLFAIRNSSTAVRYNQPLRDDALSL